MTDQRKDRLESASTELSEEKLSTVKGGTLGPKSVAKRTGPAQPRVMTEEITIVTEN